MRVSPTLERVAAELCVGSESTWMSATRKISRIFPFVFAASAWACGPGEIRDDLTSTPGIGGSGGDVRADATSPNGIGGNAPSGTGGMVNGSGGVAGGTGGGAPVQDAAIDRRTSDAALVDARGSTGPHSTFYVDGRALRDPCGQEVILRGINKMLVYADRSCASCAEIARTGANAIRMMWFTAVPLSQAEMAVNNAVSSGLIPILEMQDATCDALGSSVDAIVDFWVQSASVSFIQKHQAHLIVNIANEAGDSESASAFRTYYAGAVQKMRAAGIHTPLMIDANNCGRNGELLLSVAPGLLSDDPEHNLLFSMHWYDSGSSQTARVTNVMQTAVTNNIPFLIGEFANVGVPQCSTSPGVPYKQIMAEAQARGIGYIPWEWGPGNQDCKPATGNSPFDMTTASSFATLQPGWAMEVTMTDPASIKNTSVRSAFITGGGSTCP